MSGATTLVMSESCITSSSAATRGMMFFAFATDGARAQDVVKIGMSFAMTGAGFNAAVIGFLTRVMPPRAA